MESDIPNSISRDESGVLLIDILMALLISGALMLGLAFTYLNATYAYHNHSLKIDTQQKANGLLSAIGNEFKIIGAGVPLSQDEFSMSDVSLGTASLPVLTTSDESFISFRISKKGKFSVVASDYTPSGSDLSFDVLDASVFSTGDEIYISNLERAGEQALYGTINNISSNTITIDSGYIASTGAVFEEGSSVYKTDLVEYDSPGDWSGITRDSGSGEMTVLPNSKFTLTYYDENGNTISPPLSRSDIANNLSSLHLKIDIQSRTTLKDGSYYLATAEQSILLRNLNISRHLD